MNSPALDSQQHRIGTRGKSSPQANVIALRSLRQRAFEGESQSKLCSVRTRMTEYTESDLPMPKRVCFPRQLRVDQEASGDEPTRSTTPTRDLPTAVARSAPGCPLLLGRR